MMVWFMIRWDVNVMKADKRQFLPVLNWVYNPTPSNVQASLDGGSLGEKVFNLLRKINAVNHQQVLHVTIPITHSSSCQTVHESGI
jgi:hypothetical protein